MVGALEARLWWRGMQQSSACCSRVAAVEPGEERMPSGREVAGCQPGTGEVAGSDLQKR